MIVAYTDGACIGNPGPGGWAAILFDELGGERVLSGGAPDTTNNRMELTAAIEALRLTPPGEPVHVVTDSTYVMNGVTKWAKGWQRSNWHKRGGEPVPNRELWQQLVALAGAHVTWEWVRGHDGHPLNERVDRLARAQARDHQSRRPPARPPAAPVSLAAGHQPQSGNGRAPTNQATARSAKAPTGQFYLSLVDGELQRHDTWEQCRARVHGVGGARYRKVKDAAEAEGVLRAWGLAPRALAALG